MYTPLGQNEIRLLTISPTPNNGVVNLLQCTLSIHSLDDDAASCPEYTALSYTWGSPTDTPVRIIINGRERDVQPNLASALHAFRARSQFGPVWAGAMCVDQSDLAEKSAQVSAMGGIFARAARTVIWLGPASDDSDLAMDFLAAFTKADLEERFTANLQNGVWSALERLTKRRWWSRVWVCQEALLSRDPVVWCGTKGVPLTQLVILNDLYSMTIWNDMERWKDYTLFLKVPFAFCLLKWDRIRARLRDNGGMSLFDMLRSLSIGWECTILHDRVYGVLGLCLPGEREVIVPDYERDLRDVLIDVAVRAIHTNGFDVLNTVGAEVHKSVRGLPSWVPDLTIPVISAGLHVYDSPDTDCRFKANVHPLHDAWTTLFHNAADIPENERRLLSAVDRQKDIFVMYGVLVDIVTFASAAPIVKHRDIDVANQTGYERWGPGEEMLKECESVALDTSRLAEGVVNPYADLPGGRKEALWRTIIYDTSEMKGKRPAPDGFGELFEVLLRGRRPPSSPYTSPRNEESTDMADSTGARMGRSRKQQYSPLALLRCHKKVFFLTDTGRMGLTIRGVQAGDLVVVARGGETPYILRRQAGSETEDGWGYRFKGEAYVHGIMDGEAVHEAVKNGGKAMKFALR